METIEEQKKAFIRRLWEWLREHGYDFTLDEVRELHGRNFTWQVEKAYVVVINYSCNTSPVRSIVEVQQPYEPEAFTERYYLENPKLDGDEFVYCPTPAHMFECVKAAENRGTVYENKNEASSAQEN